MSRIMCVLCLLAWLSPVWAQPAERIKLRVDPAPVPARSLQYLLFPPTRELTPGNAATLYQRSLAMLFENEHLLKDLKQEHWQRWSTADIASWPKDEVEGKLRMTRHMVRELELAARKKDCDWLLDNRSEGIGLLLPDLQAFRTAGLVLAVQARHQAITGQLEAATMTIQTGMALARHVARGPTAIHVLVGVAIAHRLVEQIEILVQQPKCPNLYWSLTVLPHPFIDPAPVFDTDQFGLENSIPWAKQLEDRAWTQEQVSEARAAIQRMLDDFGVRRPGAGDIATRTLLEIKLNAEAAEALKKELASERMKGMPAFQVTAIYLFRECRRASEEVAKWAHLPDDLSHPGYAQAVQQYNAAYHRLDRMYFQGLLKGLANGSSEGVSPPLGKLVASSSRLERRLAALRVVEAIRIHLASSGKLPSSLGEIKEVPVPIDPVLRKAFQYSVEDGAARLETIPVAKAPSPSNRLAYEIRPR